MKKLLFLSLLFSTFLFPSCDDDDTYAEMRDRERKQISNFLKNGCEVWDADSSVLMLNVGKINVISESQFYAQDSTTDVSKNEYVLFKNTGLYMQIVRKGTGKPLQEGESKTVVMRYYEYNIAADSLQSTNQVLAYEAFPDVMIARNNYGTITASFTEGLMKTLYNSAAVPSGWIIPLNFIKLGRQDSPDAEIALVRLIVPSTEGQIDASSDIYPCFYEISYQAGR